MTDPLEQHLSERLRARAASAHVSPDAYERIVERGTRARRLSVVAAVGGVTAIAAAALAVPVLASRQPTETTVSFGGPSSSESSSEVWTEPPPQPSPSAPEVMAEAPSAPELVPDAWQRAADAGDLAQKDASGVDVLEFNGRAIAVGSIRGLADPTQPYLQHAAIWVSDGQRWSRVPDDEDLFGTIPDPMPESYDQEHDRAPDWLGMWSSIKRVAAGNDALVAVGQVGLVPTVWRSEDGLEWQRITLPGDGQILDMLWTGERFLVTGAYGYSMNGAGAAVLWTSQDGVAWEREETSFPPAGGLTSAGERVVMLPSAARVMIDANDPARLATEGATAQEPREPSVLVSDDGGRTFFWEALSGPPFDDPEALGLADAKLLGLADGTFLAVILSIGDIGRLIAYTSPDGSTWTYQRELPAPPDPGALYANDLLEQEDGTIVAVGANSHSLDREDFGSAAVWTSPDGGASWSQTADPNGVFDESTEINAVTETEQGLVAVGTEGWSDRRGAAWVLPE